MMHNRSIALFEGREMYIRLIVLALLATVLFSSCCATSNDDEAMLETASINLPQ